MSVDTTPDGGRTAEEQALFLEDKKQAVRSGVDAVTADLLNESVSVSESEVEALRDALEGIGDALSDAGEGSD